MAKMPRILVVDDEPGIRELFSEILQVGGYEVRLAATGEEALRVQQESRPELVLLDVTLPDTDGFQVCRALKQDAAANEVCVALPTLLRGGSGFCSCWTGP
jgi:CheY-like chemotaxis protein